MLCYCDIPSTPSEPNTITKCTDELYELLTDVLASQVDIIILGDFNIHVNDENDPDAYSLLTQWKP